MSSGPCCAGGGKVYGIISFSGCVNLESSYRFLFQDKQLTLTKNYTTRHTKGQGEGGKSLEKSRTNQNYARGKFISSKAKCLDSKENGD